MGVPVRRDRKALIAFIEARAAMAHDFDGNDCVSFTMGAVAAQFGSHPEIGVRWHDERSAKRAIATLGGIEAATDARFARIAPHEAQFGDIAGVVDEETGFHLMLVEGQMLVAPGEAGLARLPRSRMVAAWRARGAVS
ncbi:hypothetical protein [Alteriqipengyuania sp.]|uniref:DUF6950 family protein n=1 Tax=Alteriqipengyuania sp. TaxID=2800692 RepID=UPI003518158A